MATFLLLIAAQHRACALSPHSLPVLTPKLTCGLLVPVLDQGLVEMHFGINSQPSSLAIYTTLAELCWLLSDSAVDISLRPSSFSAAALQVCCCWRRVQQGRGHGAAAHARVRAARAARAVATRELAWRFSPVPSCYVMLFGSWYLSSS